jgi:glycosyltransferase involved in cell wall biosynthesis
MAENTSAAPLVSFCFTTFKRGAVLKSTLETIRLQGYTNYEVIVSDNDPEASGRPFVESMNDPRFRYFCNGQNLGMKPSFNKSLERSSGEYIVMIADDDPVYPDMLQTLINLREANPGYGMYMGGCDWFCADKEVAKQYKLHVGTNSCISDAHDLNFVQIFKPAEFIKNLFTFGIFSHFLWSTCIVRREILVKLGGIPDYGTPFLGDYAYMSVASTQGVVVLNRALGCQTIHKENFGRNQNEQLPVLTRNFPVYMESKLSYLPEWPEIKKLMERFFGLWITGHMAFLHHYYQKNGLDNKSLIEAEREVFKTDFIQKFRIKYVLKKRTPALHDFIVKAKKLIKG